MATLFSVYPTPPDVYRRVSRFYSWWFQGYPCYDYAKIARNQTLASLYPNRILSLHINGSVLDKETQHSVLKYLAVYVLIILSLVTVLSLDNQDLLIVTSAAASTFNNIGPLLGTTDSFAIFSPLSKLIMGFAMIAGRLEIYPLLLLFLPKTWSKT